MSSTFIFRTIFPLLLIWFSPTFAQQLVKPASEFQMSRVRLILVQGNDKTKKEIILREMKTQPGDTLITEQLAADRLRVLNLGIFNRVEFDLLPTETGAILVVTVSEMWYIFPYPIVFRNDRDWGRISVGAGLLHNNFRGRREVLDFSGWLGFNPALRLKYSNPWVLGKTKLYTKVSLFARRVRNRSFTVLDSVLNENQLGFKFTLGKRFGLFTYLDFNLGYRRMTLSPEGRGATLSASGKDQLPSLGFSFRYDSRDLFEYPHKGNFINFWATKTGIPGKTIDYFRYGADVRKYFPVGPTTLAFRGGANLSDGRIPIYDQVHFGFLTRIRGYFGERRTGENILICIAEFRFPIWPIHYYNWGTFDSLGQYGSNLRLGLSGGLFFDTGRIWFQENGSTFDGFDTGNVISGWGGGLHIFLPYNMLLRVEYGFDEGWDGQLIVDALVSF